VFLFEEGPSGPKGDRMTSRIDELITVAIDQTKIGGDPQAGIVFALAAVAIAIQDMGIERPSAKTI
jgi:hypothetical protein